MKNMSLKIGCHLSSSKGYLAMGKMIISLGGNTFQYFTRNPRGGSVKTVDYNDIKKFNDFAKENNIDYIIAHAPYTMNLASSDEKVRDFGYRVIKEDLETLEHIDKVYYNFHPGSHVGQGIEMGIDLIADTLNKVISPNQKTLVLLETMAGKGSEIGSNFSEIKSIINKVEHKEKIGVLLDTCHVNDGGYDIVNHLDEVLKEFDEIIGINLLKAIHLNDSKNPRGSHKDRHEKIGLGTIGLESLVRIINHPLLRELPFVLETPNDNEGYKEEIKFLKERYL